MRLKTKLVVIITGLVFLLVSIVSWLYLSRSLQQNVEQNYLSTDIIAHQVLFATRQAIEEGVREHTIDPAAQPAQLRTQISQTLHGDGALGALMDSVISYSPTVFDITVADSHNRALLSTDPAIDNRPLPYRPRYATLRFRSPFKVVGVVTGRPRVYDVPLALERNGQPFATVHVGIRTTFLLQVFRPWLLEAFTFVGLAILISLVLAAFVANLALAPLEDISRRLDALSQDRTDDEQQQPHDAVLQVSNKIERIGKRMRNVEEVFSALKENLDQILSNLQDGVMLFTRDLRVVLVSSSVERFLGADRDQLLGASVSEIFDRQTVLGRMICDAFDRGLSIPQAEVETETGRRLEIGLEMIQNQVAATGGGSAEDTLGALLTMHDLESVREIEDELELSHRLAAIGRLTSGVGHEVKNPINAIVVHLELMKTKLTGDEAPAMRHLNVIQSEIQRLDRVVQTLVDFSRPIEPKMHEQDLRQLVLTVLQLASDELATRSVTVISRLPENPVLVKVDADMVRQALLNIVLNGGQAMPQGGTLTLTLDEDGRAAVLSVADQGEGIAPEILPRIFDLYFTTKKDGSGIGLAMTYRIIQLHSGVVEVESQLGAGTTFTLRIPSLHGPDPRNRAQGSPRGATSLQGGGCSMKTSALLLIAAAFALGIGGCHRKVVPPPPAASTAPPLPPPSSMTHAPTLPPVPQPNTPKVGPPGSDQTAAAPPPSAPVRRVHRPRKKASDSPAGIAAATGSGTNSATPPVPSPNPSAPGQAPVPAPTLGQLSAGSGTDSKELAAMNEEIRIQENRLTGIKRPLSGDAEAVALQVRAFLAKARQAANDNDLDGARTLTTKAKVLLDELSSS